MECIFTLLMFAGFNLNVKAQTPNLISYQAVIRNASGALVSGKTVKARISILKDSANGTAVYTETHQVKTNANGLMSLQIGGGTVVSGNFNTIDWGKTNYYTKQEIDPDGGTNYSINGVSQMLSVPYALHAKNAEKCFQHYVGELYGGGVVFDVWKDTAGVEHGLIVNKYWLGSNLDITALSLTTDSLFRDYNGATSGQDGYANSLVIANAKSHIESAAKYCLDLSEGGYEDWYLGSVEEIYILIENMRKVDATLKNKGFDICLTEFGLMTSTETDWNFYIWRMAAAGEYNPTSKPSYLAYRLQGDLSKGSSVPFRAIRKF
jgi:hypothetical protein